MNKQWWFIGIILFSAISALLFVWRVVQQPDNKQAPQKGPLAIVCTTELLADAVRQIGGEHVSVYALMGPGVDPHTYHARESDVQRLAQAGMIVYNGLHLEGKMGQLFEQMAHFKPTIGVAEHLDKGLLRSSGYHNAYDPHIWFDVSLWMRIVEILRDTLSAFDPAHTNEYHHNAARYLNELHELHTYITKKSAQIPASRRVLITAHDAFAYFGRAYGYQVEGLQGISTDSEIGIADIMRLVSLIVERDVPVIFTEASIPKSNIEAVQKSSPSAGQAGLK